MNLLRHTAPQSSGAAGIAEVLRHTKIGSAQPEQVRGHGPSSFLDRTSNFGCVLCPPHPPPPQRLSVQEVPPLLNGDSARSQQQQRVLPSSHSDTGTTQGSPQVFRSLAFGGGGGAAGGSSQGSSPQHASTPVSASASPLPDAADPDPAAAGIPAQPSALLLTSTSNLSPCLIPSTVMSLSQLSPTGGSLQGMTVPIPHSAPHSPPLPHSAPLSRAMTPVQLLHQQVGPGASNTLSASHNPWFLKSAEMSATATLPLPRRPVSEMRLGGFQGETNLPRFRRGSTEASELLEKLPVFTRFHHGNAASLSSAGSSLPRMLPLSGPAHVEAVFAHTPGASPGGGACLLHFLPGDNITLLISEPRDGWHYGQNERTGRCVSCSSQAQIFNRFKTAKKKKKG